MKEFSTNLSSAQIERLAILSEEAGEVVQMIGKILRHGYESYHPANPHANNKFLLEEELLDMACILDQMIQKGDLEDFTPTEQDLQHRWKKKLRYTHYQ